MARNRQRAKDRKAGRAPEPDPIHREDVPGELEHASAEVDLAEAAIVAGAGGEGGGDEPPTGRDDGDDAESGDPGAAGPAKTRLGPMGFLRASWAELRRVQWPDRRQVGQGTAVTLGFVVLAGAYLGLADIGAERLVDLII